MSTVAVVESQNKLGVRILCTWQIPSSETKNILAILLKNRGHAARNMKAFWQWGSFNPICVLTHTSCLERSATNRFDPDEVTCQMILFFYKICTLSIHKSTSALKQQKQDNSPSNSRDTSFPCLHIAVNSSALDRNAGFWQLQVWPSSVDALIPVAQYQLLWKKEQGQMSGDERVVNPKHNSRPANQEAF